MYLRALLATALLVPTTPAYGQALSLVPSILPETINPSPIPKVVCLQKDGYSAGTAVKIGPHLLVSVNHVTNKKNCQIDGQPIHVIYTSPKADFSILSDDRATSFLKVDCGGFIKGHTYIAIGHARALNELTAVPMIATGEYSGSQAMLEGVFEVQPGQSGGAIIDAETGQVVGVVNAALWEMGLTFSTELKGTSICGGDKA